MTTALHFDDAWREHVRLRDGRQVVLRLGRPNDRELLRRGFDRLSPESRYRRFFTPKPRLSEAELDYLTQIDQYDHIAIGAFEQSNSHEEGLGVARCVRLEDKSDTAEAAVAVIDDAQGNGLGGLLFQRLAAAARERGITHFASTVLGDNKAMQELIGTLTNRVESHIEDGVMYFEFDLPEIGPDHPALSPPRSHGFYRLMRNAARGLLRVRKP